MEYPPVDAWAWPALFRCPFARMIFVPGPRPLLAGDPHAILWLVHDAGRFAAEPMPPPAQGFLQIADARAGIAAAGIAVRPRAHDRQLGARETREQPRHGIRIGVLPA